MVVAIMICGRHGCGRHGCGRHGCDRHGCDRHGCDRHGCGYHCQTPTTTTCYCSVISYIIETFQLQFNVDCRLFLDDVTCGVCSRHRTRHR